MQEALAIFATPHFIIFILVSWGGGFLFYRQFTSEEHTFKQFSSEELSEFREKYAKPKDRIDMPSKYDDYAIKSDSIARFIKWWMLLCFASTILLTYKLLELYAL